MAAGVVVTFNCNNDLYNVRPRGVEVSLHDKFAAPILRKMVFLMRFVIKPSSFSGFVDNCRVC